MYGFSCVSSYFSFYPRDVTLAKHISVRYKSSSSIETAVRIALVLAQMPFLHCVVKEYRVPSKICKSWSDLREIHRVDVFGPSLERVWMSRSKAKGQGHEGQKTRLTLLSPPAAHEWYVLAANSVQKQQTIPFRPFQRLISGACMRCMHAKTSLAPILLFFAAARRWSQVLSTEFDQRPTPVYHSKRPLLFTT